MGKEYRKNYKTFVGRPEILGTDQWDVSLSVGQAPGGATSLTDRLGGSSYICGRDVRVNGLMVQATGVLGAGRIGLEVQANGVTIASGSLYTTGPAAEYVSLSALDTDGAVASGVSLTVNASVEQGLDAGNVIRAGVSLTILSYPEA